MLCYTVRSVVTHQVIAFALTASFFATGCSGSSADPSRVAAGGTSSALGGTGSQSDASSASALGGAIVPTGGVATGGISQAFLVNGGATTVVGAATGGNTAANGDTSSSGADSAKGGTTSNGGTTNGGTANGGTSSSVATSAKGGTTSNGGTANGGTSSSVATSAKGGTTSNGGTANGGTSSSVASSAKGGTMSDGGTTATHTGAWKIMPLGDSITNFCYPQDLSGILTANGKTNFTFVGTQTANQGNCGTPSSSSVKTEGHGGYFATYLTTNSPPQSGKGTLSELQTWAAQKPDVVLLEMGTNDVWSNISVSNIMNAYDFVVDQFRAQNPAVVFLVAQITPMHPSATCCEPSVEALNAAIPAWASGKSIATSPVYVVNIWAAIDQAAYQPNSTLTADGVHPAPAAARLMANAWYAALVAHGIP